MDETARTALYLGDNGPEPDWPVLAGPKTAEVAIVGGGLTGMSTALHLAEAGIDVALFEAQVPGWGASGRNGGQLNPGLKYDPSWFTRTFGEALGREMVEFGWSSVDVTAALVERLGIDCALRRNGTLRAAASPQDIAGVRQTFEDMRAHGMPVEWLEGEALAALTGHRRYPAALLDRRGGDLDPLRLVRGLAAAAQRAGAAIHARSRVKDLRQEKDGWSFTANGHPVHAKRVLIACNGYADSVWPGLAQASVPVFSSVLASEPLPADLARNVMPGRQVLYESGLVTVYCRVDAAHRLIIGGRGPMRPSSDPGRMSAVRRHAEMLWPDLVGTKWQHAWNGRVSVTPDHLPKLHSPHKGILIAYGYNGRGVALSTALGAHLARNLQGNQTPRALPLPVTGMKRIPFHRFWPIAVHGAITGSRIHNRLRQLR